MKKFKVGDKVKIVKALGSKPNKYMFGGTTDEVKLGQVCEIHSISELSVNLFVKDENKKDMLWTLDKEEITLYRSITDVLEELQ